MALLPEVELHPLFFVALGILAAATIALSQRFQESIRAKERFARSAAKIAQFERRTEEQETEQASEPDLKHFSELPEVRRYLSARHFRHLSSAPVILLPAAVAAGFYFQAGQWLLLLVIATLDVVLYYLAMK